MSALRIGAKPANRRRSRNARRALIVRRVRAAARDADREVKPDNAGNPDHDIDQLPDSLLGDG